MSDSALHSDWAEISQGEADEVLSEETKEEDPSGPVRIMRPDDPFGELSNLWPQNQEIQGPDGTSCRTAEHLINVLKYSYDGANTKTRVLREYIAGAPTPLKARYLANGLPKNRGTKGMQDVLRLRSELVYGNRHRKSTEDKSAKGAVEDTYDPTLARPREDWDPHSLAMMQHVVHSKFTTDARAYSVLMSTGTRPIELWSGKYDSFWGMGDPEHGVPGQNHLGRLIQAWRDGESLRLSMQD